MLVCLTEILVILKNETIAIQADRCIIMRIKVFYNFCALQFPENKKVNLREGKDTKNKREGDS